MVISKRRNSNVSVNLSTYLLYVDGVYQEMDPIVVRIGVTLVLFASLLAMPTGGCTIYSLSISYNGR